MSKYAIIMTVSQATIRVYGPKYTAVLINRSILLRTALTWSTKPIALNQNSEVYNWRLSACTVLCGSTVLEDITSCPSRLRFWCFSLVSTASALAVFTHWVCMWMSLHNKEALYRHRSSDFDSTRNGAWTEIQDLAIAGMLYQGGKVGNAH